MFQIVCRCLEYLSMFPNTLNVRCNISEHSLHYIPKEGIQGILPCFLRAHASFIRLQGADRKVGPHPGLQEHIAVISSN